MSAETILYKYKSTYYKFPQSLKVFLGSLYGAIPLSVRFGKSYNIHAKIIQEFENSTEQYKLDFMYNKTLETILFAEENIPYYKNLFNEYGISSNSFKSLDDIALFPLLTKDIIKESIDSFYSDKVETPIAYYSGGSLSTPTKFFLPNSSRAKEKAYNNYIFSKIGYAHKDRTLLLKGREVSNLKKSIFWEYEAVDNYFLLSNSYMNSAKFPMMHQKAEEFKPKFLFAYPSTLLSFIKQAKAYNLKKLNVEAVILASETVYPHELQLIEDYFGVGILTHYGHTERNAIGYRLNSKDYNFLNSYGLTRVQNREIITTTYDNFVMPFINYKSEDSVSGNIKYYKNSDIIKKVENIEGRTKDFLVTKDHRLISITTMCYNQDELFEQANAIQYVQNSIGEVTILIMGLEGDAQELENKLNSNPVHKGLVLKIKQVDYIPKTNRGKRLICKQSLDIEKFRA